MELNSVVNGIETGLVIPEGGFWGVLPSKMEGFIRQIFHKFNKKNQDCCDSKTE